MAKLADLGFRFSLDKVQTLDLDFADLQRSDVKFIKVAADLMIEQLLDLDGGAPLRSMPDIQAADFAALTRRYGVEVIAEKVENERQVVDILELDVAMGQGHLFGEPPRHQGAGSGRNRPARRVPGAPPCAAPSKDAGSANHAVAACGHILRLPADFRLHLGADLSAIKHVQKSGMPIRHNDQSDTENI